MLVTAGLEDPRVGYWEPAKWVQKLRAADPGGQVLFKVELDSGHAGPSGRYEAWRDEAFVVSFVLDAVGPAPDAAGRRAYEVASKVKVNGDRNPVGSCTGRPSIVTLGIGGGAELDAQNRPRPDNERGMPPPRRCPVHTTCPDEGSVAITQHGADASMATVYAVDGVA